MERQSSSSLSSLRSIKNIANTLILEDRMQLLLNVRELQISYTKVGDELIEIQITPTENIGLEKFMKPGDIVSYQSNELVPLISGVVYFIKTAINIRQMKKLEEDFSEADKKNTLVFFNGVDPNHYLGDQSNKFGAAIWTRSQDISIPITELSTILDEMELGQEIGKIRYDNLKKAFKQEKQKFKKKAKELEERERKSEEESKRLERERKELEELRRQIEEREKKLDEDEEKRRLENEATMKYFK